MEKIKSSWVSILSLIFLIGIVYGGYKLCQAYYDKGYAKGYESGITAAVIPEKKEPIKLPVDSTSNTVIRYVERATDDKAAVDVSMDTPKIIARANGKEYQFEQIATEKQAFEKGQLQIKQASTATVDVTQIVNDQMAQERVELKKKYNKNNEIKPAVLIGRDSAYIGIEYEAKLWDVGYYAKVHGNGSKSLIKTSYTIAKW